MPNDGVGFALAAVIILGSVTAIMFSSQAAAGNANFSAAAPKASVAAAAGTWTKVYSNPGSFWRAVRFPTPNVGYAVGGPDWSTAGPSRVAKTTDGGQTWVTHFRTGFNGWLKGLDCKDANTCFAVGQFAKFLRTTDGGTTWINGDDAAVQRCAVFAATSTRWCGRARIMWCWAAARTLIRRLRAAPTSCAPLMVWRHRTSRCLGLRR